MLTYVLVGLLITAVVYRAMVRILYPNPFPGIPYNKESANRIFGDVPYMIPIIQNTDERSGAVFSVTTHRLGTPVAQLLIPAGKPLIVLEDPREVEDIMLNRNKDFDKGPRAVNVMGPMFPNGTIGQYTTPKLKAQKRLWTDVMSAEFLRKSAAPNVYKSATELIDLWRLKASNVSLFKDHVFDVHKDLQNSALDTIWVAVIGEEAGITRYEIQKLQKKLSGSDLNNITQPRCLFLKEELEYIGDAISRNAATPVPKLMSIIETYTSRYRNSRKRITSEIEHAMRGIIQRIQDVDHQQDSCMMDFVLRRRVTEAQRARKPLCNPWEDQLILDEMFVILVGGHDSTASALTWFVRFMDTFPAAQTELRNILRTAFSHSDNLPSLEEILDTTIPYLDATCEESLRLAGIAKGNVRQALVDTEILGYKIPKGAEVFMNFHIDRTPPSADLTKRSAGSQATIAKRGDVFEGNAGRDLETFEPKRWLVRDEQTGKDRFNPNALPSLAFSGGYRGCAGRKLALMEIRIVITMLILSFEFLELPEEYHTLVATEKLFRQPAKPFSRLKVL